MIFGSRITQAREFGNLTQAELADALGVAQATISDIERGRIQPNGELATGIANALRFPPAFFERDVSPHFAIGSLEFRARNSVPAKRKKHAHHYGHIVFELASFLAGRLETPPVHLPRVEGDAERAAAIVRSELGVSPEGPIYNLTDALERAGVFVFALPTLTDGSLEGIDGFSVWAGRGQRLVPVIFVSATIPGDRQRLTVAHEIGELALADLPPGKEREAQANHFAGAFLMPSEKFKEELVPPFSVYDFIEMKKRYAVSIQAALVRARHLDLIDDRRYHALYQQLSARGWVKEEPPGTAVPREKPRGLHKMVELLYGDPIDIVRLAADSRLDPWFLRQLLATHANKADLHGAVLHDAGKVLAFPKSHAQGRTGIISKADEA